MTQRQFSPGDVVYTFVGENLVFFEVTEYYDNKRLLGKNGDHTYCVFEKYCYSKRKNAIQGMKIYLQGFVDGLQDRVKSKK